MNWKFFDRARREAHPLELDLVESYAQGKINRRDFLRRGTVIGLSMPFMGAIIAACGGGDDDGGSGDGASGDDGTSAPGTTAGGSAGGGAGGGVIVAIQQGDANSGLDPVNMLDLGTYNVIAQSFEFLVGVGDDGNIGPTGLAESWEPNEDASVWTFKLREGVKWHSGADFTSADVAATMDRLAAAENAGLAGVIAEGSVDSSDPATAVITLEQSNGNFPVLVSIFNAQSCITPADYSSGTTLDERPDGTGAWKLDSWDASTFTANFVANPDWWGGSLALDSVELRGFADIATAVTAMQSREINAIQQFSVLAGKSLLEDSNFTVLTPPSATHRQVWFNTVNGQFTDPRVRQALAWAVNREQMVTTLFEGKAEIANDHPVLSSLPFFDPDAVEQRAPDAEQAKQLLADAGVESLQTVISTGDLQEVPQLAAIIQANLAEIGVEVQVDTQSNSTFYGAAWCPEGGDPPCSESAEFGIVDYGHRPVPDVYFTSALKSGGVWNSSVYQNPEFDAEVTNYQTAADVEGQKKAVGAIQKILWEDVPAIYPYFYNYLSGSDASVQGMQATALGHTLFNKASVSG